MEHVNNKNVENFFIFSLVSNPKKSLFYIKKVDFFLVFFR